MGRYKILFIVLSLLITIPTFSLKRNTNPYNKDSVKKSFNMDKLKKELADPIAEKDSKNKDDSKYVASGSKEAILVTLKLMFFIAIIAVLLYFAIKLFKGNSLGKGLGGKKSKTITLLESSFIAPGKAISLVKIAGKVLVVGTTEKSMNLLTTLDDKESIHTVLENNRETATGVSGNFSNTVNSFLDKFKREEEQAKG